MGRFQRVPAGGGTRESGPIGAFLGQMPTGRALGATESAPRTCTFRRRSMSSGASPHSPRSFTCASPSGGRERVSSGECEHGRSEEGRRSSGPERWFHQDSTIADVMAGMMRSPTAYTGAYIRRLALPVVTTTRSRSGTTAMNAPLPPCAL